jgi:hypothetical protein
VAGTKGPNTASQWLGYSGVGTQLGHQLQASSAAQPATARHWLSPRFTSCWLFISAQCCIGLFASHATACSIPASPPVVIARQRLPATPAIVKRPLAVAFFVAELPLRNVQYLRCMMTRE